MRFPRDFRKPTEYEQVPCGRLNEALNRVSRWRGDGEWQAGNTRLVKRGERIEIWRVYRVTKEKP